jgi:hypothetical protein
LQKKIEKTDKVTIDIAGALSSYSSPLEMRVKKQNCLLTIKAILNFHQPV